MHFQGVFSFFYFLPARGGMELEFFMEIIGRVASFASVYATMNPLVRQTRCLLAVYSSI